MTRLVPAWIGGYQRPWLRPDLIAGVVIWSVVVPQAVAYAQIAGLPPEAGLMAAPGALIAYALIGGSHTLVVSATTATSAVSAAAVAPLAGGHAATFAALSAALALLTALVLVAAGALRLGGLSDLVSTPVMTGFLFGLGMTVTVGQLPKVLGLPEGEGNFFPRAWDIISDLGDVHGPTLAAGAASLAALILLKRLAPGVPATLVVLAGSIVFSALLGLDGHGVDVVGELPTALPDPSWPGVSTEDLVDLLPAAFGIWLVTTEAVGVSRTLATADGYEIDANRELIAIGGSNLLAGLSAGFVQSGGASQTMAAEEAGGKSQLSSVVAAGLILLTGGLLAPVFTDLPQATLGAIVIVAIAGFYRVDEFRRFARVRTSALVFASIALGGVLLFGVLPGLLIAAGLSMMSVIQRLSRPSVGQMARDPATGQWGRADRHPDWQPTHGVLAASPDGALFYANAGRVKEQLVALVRAAEPRPTALALDLEESPDLDLGTADALADLAKTLAAEGVELRLVGVHAPVLAVLQRSGLASSVGIDPTLDSAVNR